jgi:peroxiredoxin Q/BCP
MIPGFFAGPVRPFWYAHAVANARQFPTFWSFQEICMARQFLAGVTALVFVIGAWAEEPAKQAAKKVDVGTQAPAFKIKDANGKTIDLAELTAKGPVLVRLTCGCSGCDKELAYFQAMHEAYKDKGLTSLAIFKEPDAKVAAYVKEKKLNMLYAVDTKGDSWNVFETKTMPTNFLIEKGGKIVQIAAGCDPSGLLAKKLSEKVAKTVNSESVDVQKKVDEERKEKK